MSYNKIQKDKLDYYLNELAKEYHKRGRKSRGEIILIGGAAIIANYDFRCMSEDADSIIYAESHLKEAILTVARNNNLPDDWLNQDFVQTSSYSDKIAKYAKNYKQLSYGITYKIVDREYLTKTLQEFSCPLWQVDELERFFVFALYIYQLKPRYVF